MKLLRYDLTELNLRYMQHGEVWNIYVFGSYQRFFYFRLVLAGLSGQLFNRNVLAVGEWQDLPVFLAKYFLLPT